MEINSRTIFTGLFGHPVGHSLSPLMHNRAFEVLGLNYRYGAFDIHSSQLESAVAGIRSLGLRGVNVTVPYKVDVIPYLDEIDEEARLIGAVNTIVNENGRLIGYNTDGRGYVRSLIEECGLQLEQESVLLLGAGGAARGVAVALLRTGVKRLTIANRTVKKAEQLALDLSRVSEQATGIRAISMEEVAGAITKSTILVQTTSIGMHPNIEESPIPSSLLHPDLLVSDLIYNPLKTKLQRDAEAMGTRTHSGVGMFIYQGALSFEYWTGREAPVEVMRDIVYKELARTKK
ncbi:shikimate dehydrogenase [Aneurinibacillus terranovensis]|uniref:shikimate dehydrogenase n=1 Tax=Aneurinibacillus terranovensis TaxID=278991 RepID=UPI0003F66698|nr:shikimate dehydrogenase [Aneurinibacillus terranovensis]